MTRQAGTVIWATLIAARASAGGPQDPLEEFVMDSWGGLHGSYTYVVRVEEWRDGSSVDAAVVDAFRAAARTSESAIDLFDEYVKDSPTRERTHEIVDFRDGHLFAKRMIGTKSIGESLLCTGEFCLAYDSVSAMVTMADGESFVRFDMPSIWFPFPLQREYFHDKLNGPWELHDSNGDIRIEADDDRFFMLFDDDGMPRFYTNKRDGYTSVKAWEVKRGDDGIVYPERKVELVTAGDRSYGARFTLMDVRWAEASDVYIDVHRDAEYFVRPSETAPRGRLYLDYDDWPAEVRRWCNRLEESRPIEGARRSVLRRERPIPREPSRTESGDIAASTNRLLWWGLGGGLCLLLLWIVHSHRGASPGS